MFQGIHKYIREEYILLDLDSYLEVPEEFEDLAPSKKFEFKKQILKILIGQFDKSGLIVNPSKCLTDMSNREAKATTGMQDGIAIPHVRTLQAKDLILTVMRSDQGVYFDSLDKSPIHVFIGLICPPYNDKIYLKCLSALSEHIRAGELYEKLYYANSAKEILSIFCRMK